METKICRQCGLVLPVDFFYSHIKNNGKIKYRARCKICEQENYKASREKQGLKVLLSRGTPVINRICNSCKENKSISCFYKTGTKSNGEIKYKYVCKSCSDAENKKWKNSTDWYKKNYLKNQDKFLDKIHKYYEENREARLGYQDKYYKKNKKKIMNARKVRYHKDVLLRLRLLLGNRLRNALKGNHKKSSIVKYLGCSLEYLREHLEKQFREGMSWNNHGCGEGSWHIDHIKPLVSFDLTQEDQIHKACHFSNLQPLWEKENLSKGARI